MNLNRINLKLGGTIIALFLAILFPLGFVIHEIFSGFYMKSVEEENKQLSSQYASLISDNYDDGIFEVVDLMSSFSQVKLYVVDKDGNVTISNIDFLKKGDKISKEELSDLRQGLLHEKIFDETHHKTYYISGSPIFNENLFLGGVFVLTSIEGVIASLEKIQNLISFAAFGSFLLALGLTFIFSKKLSYPLLEMERATREIAKGDLDTKLIIRSKDEIGSLGEAINDLARDLKRYRDTRNEFLANISHELRTPLTYLKGYSRVLKEEKYKTKEEKNNYLSIIEDEATRLTRLINDLSELSTIEEGNINLNLEIIDVSEVLEGVVSKAKLRAEQKGLQFKLTKVNDLPYILGDGLRLEQIFINLIENAIRYTDHGLIEVQITLNEKEVKVIIKDTGQGMAAEDLPYIFERFYRVEKSRSREFGGSGLGLSIVKKLVEVQNGTISVKSKLNVGTTITVTFPSVSGDKEGEGL